MPSPLSAAEDFLSPAAKYEMYNFHRRVERARMLEALNAPRPRIVTLAGLDEENHLLLLESACHQSSRQGNGWECVRVSFEDFDPDVSTAESFLNDQITRQNAPGREAEKLRQCLSALALGFKAELDISSAFAISLAVSGGLRFAELLEAAAPTFHVVRGYPAPGPERLRAVLETLTATTRLVLYVPGSYPLPVTLRRWLINACKHDDRLLLAFANVDAGGAGEMTVGVPVREHFACAPLSTTELAEVVNGKFGPNTFPRDFYEALWFQSKGIPWRVAEVMKRLMYAGALEGGGTRPWSLSAADGGYSTVADQFISTFYEPVDQLRESRDPRQRLIAEFVHLGALFSAEIPAGFLATYIDVDEQTVNAFLDDVLLWFGPGSELPILAEGRPDPAVPDRRIFRFTNELARQVLLDGLDAEGRHEAASELLVAFEAQLASVSHTSARVLYTLSQHLESPETADGAVMNWNGGSVGKRPRIFLSPCRRSCEKGDARSTS